MSGAPTGDLVFGVIQTLGEDRDGDILGPQDRATKALYHRPLGRRRIFLVLKSSTRLVVESGTPSSICFLREFSSDGMQW